MIKLLIADDEPRIRAGLASCLDYASLGIAIVSLAKDGNQAYIEAKKHKPDILLLDICMPKLSGLELIEKLKHELPACTYIIISGHDEFPLAQKACSLGVTEYILKPINETKLQQVLERAIEHTRKRNATQHQEELAHNLLQRNLPFLRMRFVSDLLKSALTKEEVREQLDFHSLKVEADYVLILASISDVNYIVANGEEWSKQLFRFRIQGIVSEILSECAQAICVMDDQFDNLVWLCEVTDSNKFEQFEANARIAMENGTGQTINLYCKRGKNIFDMPAAYEDCQQQSSVNLSEIVTQALRLLNKNISCSDFNAKQLATQLNVNASYLSHLFKHETGKSISEYQTQIRIQMAISMLKNKNNKIYEIADAGADRCQHYFCAAFKRITGVSPSQYYLQKD